jgi:hypothetical protein
MLTRYITVKEWIPVYKNPITLIKGDLVKIGREDDQWKGWIWCQTKDNSGWVPKQIIKFTGEDNGEVTEDYVAREIDVDAGEEILEIKELNGWIWGRHEKTNKEGWLPKEILKPSN